MNLDIPQELESAVTHSERKNEFVLQTPKGQELARVSLRFDLLLLVQILTFMVNNRKKCVMVLLRMKQTQDIFPLPGQRTQEQTQLTSEQCSVAAC